MTRGTMYSAQFKQSQINFGALCVAVMRPGTFPAHIKSPKFPRWVMITNDILLLLPKPLPIRSASTIHMAALESRYRNEQGTERSRLCDKKEQ